MTSVVDRTAAPGTTCAAELRGVGKVFGRGAAPTTVLDGVDLRVGQGDFVVLLGASGCGKTTLLNLVAGLDRPTTGSVTTATDRPAVVFQEPALMPWMTAVRNVELPLRLAGASRRARRMRALELLELVRLSGQADRRPHELSGGMRQRVALARALASTTADGDGGGLLLMDEPFAALDAITRDVMQAELVRIWRTTGTAVLFVTHDVREAVRLGRRVVLLSSRPGTVVAQWDPPAWDGRTDGLVTEITARLREGISSHAAP